MYFLAASRLLAIVVLLGILQLDKCQQEDEVIVLRDTTLRIEHSLGGEVFTPRCTIRITVKSDGKQTLQFLDRNGIFAEEVASFQDRLSKNALYKIRIQSISESNHTSPWIVSSIPSVSK